MCRVRLLAIALAVTVLAGACAGNQNNSSARRGADAGPDSGVSEVDPRSGTSPEGAEAAESQQTAGAVADTAPTRLGDRFGWCARVQALWNDEDVYRAEAEATAAAHRDAVSTYEAASDDLDRAEAQEAVERTLSENRLAASAHGRARWRNAGLMVGDASSLDPRDWDDATLQVALERAREAFRASAVADTLAALDLAREATEAAARLSAAARSTSDESDQVVDTPEPDEASFDASKAWLRALEALQDAAEAAGDAENAQDAAIAAAEAARAAVGDAEDAAAAISRSAQADGDWEAMITAVEDRTATARSAAEAAEDFATQALEARAAAQAAAESARAAEQASDKARDLAEQSGATEGEQAYRDAPVKATAARVYAERAASVAALSVVHPTRVAADAAPAVQEAAWNAARILAGVDGLGVAAFKESLQQSCE